MCKGSPSGPFIHFIGNKRHALFLKIIDENKENVVTDKEFDEFIEERGKGGIVLGLDNIRILLEKMGNPQDKLRFVHVAGTNGKGSIVSYIAQILKCAGYKTGKYTSPAVVEYREKIQINEKNISKKMLYEGMELIKSIVDKMQENEKPTVFEIETALAFWYFEKSKCDIVVVETGMGGRDDATNVIKNTLVSVFARISYDHMAILGDTLSEIATVKAGIIKNKSSVISINQEDEVKSVLEAEAKKNNAELKFVPIPTKIKYGLNHQKFTTEQYNDLEISLTGTYQPHNAAVAVMASLELISKGFNITKEHIRTGLKNTSWFGRFSVMNKKPLVIVDGAHNEEAALVLRESVDEYLKDKSVIYMMGMLRDKEYDKVLKIMGDRADAIVTLTPPSNPRALSAIELANEASKYCNNVTSCDSVEEAYEISCLLAGKEKAILIFGSLSFLGRVKNIFDSKKK